VLFRRGRGVQPSWYRQLPRGGRLVDALEALDAHARRREHNRQRLGLRPRETHDVAPVDALGVSDDTAYPIHPIVPTIGPLSLGD
jgi:hypothetical protein